MIGNENGRNYSYFIITEEEHEVKGNTDESGNFIDATDTAIEGSKKTYYCIGDTFCDLLFCYCENGDMYLIPVTDIYSNTMISLYKEKPKNTPKDSFDSSKYLI